MTEYVKKVAKGILVAAVLALVVGGLVAPLASPVQAASAQVGVPPAQAELAFGRGWGGMKGICPPPIDRAALLAQELGISVDELRAAQERAAIAAVQQAVELGLLDEDQADLRIATIKLRNYIDRQALAAQALGMTTDELQAACEEGTTLRDLLEERDMTRADFADALQAAFEAAVQQAVEDGVITQDQADQILEGRGLRGPKGFGFRGRGGRGGRFGGWGWGW